MVEVDELYQIYKKIFKEAAEKILIALTRHKNVAFNYLSDPMFSEISKK